MWFDGFFSVHPFTFFFFFFEPGVSPHNLWQPPVSESQVLGLKVCPSCPVYRTSLERQNTIEFSPGSSEHTYLKCFFIHAESPGNGGCWWKQIPKMDSKGTFPIQLGAYIDLLLFWELPHLQETKAPLWQLYAGYYCLSTSCSLFVLFLRQDFTL